MIIIAFFFKSPKRKVADLTLKEKLVQLDPVGVTFLLGGVICLLMALQWGGNLYAWDDSVIIGLLIGFGLMIICFIALQLYFPDTATIPPRLMKKRSVSAGAMTVFSLFSGFIIFVYFIPIYFQAVFGDSATDSGIKSIPLVLADTVGSITSGLLTTIFGYFNPYLYIGTVLAAIGAGLITTFGVDTSAGEWIGYQILNGIGTGMAFQLPLIAVQTILPLADVSSGVSIIMFFQSFGGALFIGIAQSIFQTNLVNNIVAVVPDIPPSEILSVGAAQLDTIIPAEDIPAVLVGYAKALDQTFIIATVMICMAFVFSLGIEWKSVKGKQLSGMA